MNLTNNDESYAHILSHTQLIENDMKMTTKFIKEQNNLDERLTNNILKLNAVGYLMNLTMIFTLMFFSTNLFTFEISSSGAKLFELTFSLLTFTKKKGNEGIITNFYNCIFNENCDNKCEGVNIKEILKISENLKCEYFFTFQIAGIIVRIKY